MSKKDFDTKHAAMDIISKYSKNENTRKQSQARINMAFTPDNIDFIRKMSRAKGISITSYVNSILAKERENNTELLKKFDEFLQSNN